jgi:beta-galactosidase
MKSSTCMALLLAAIAPAHAALTDGRIALSGNDLQPGTHTDLTGQWYYKPGYAVADGERPETESDNTGFVPVAVPQFLNRIYWWLDDSEDFKKREDRRLMQLGFDTDRAEDGWYRLQVELPALPKGRHLFLEFEGVAMKCKVFCNGHLLGDHQGMFSRFAFDLTGHLQEGGNCIAVFVSMEKIFPSTLSMGKAVTVNLTASKVKTMSKGMYGPFWAGADNRTYDLHGIWQPVSLVAREDAQIDDVWFVPSLDGGEVKMRARLLEPQAVTVKAEWIDDKTGRSFAQAVSPTLQPGAADFAQTLSLRHVQPKLWTPAEPNLYRLQVTVAGSGGQVLDQWNGKVGFRTFEIRGNRFFLNGHPWWLRGADHLPYGKNPWDPQLAHKLIQLLHDANLNVTRTHGMPWNEAWLDAADEIGLGVSIEGIRPWGLAGKIGPTPPDMFEQWLRENQEVIERCRNHPSVLIYTVGNEMMLKDQKNVKKWEQLSAVVKQTRQVDPTRPVIASSEYQRDPKFYKKVLQPHGIDDGDIDDLHRYNNWYGPSSFVTDSKFKNEMKRNGGKRPLMGQEMSTGYPDLDSGLPVFRYTRDLLTPQAWVGPNSYPGSDPAVYLENDRAVTKRWAEQLRFQRETNTAGFMLFAAECWFSHSYDPQTLTPYPAYDAMRQADAPVGLAWATGRRRFFGGEKVKTAVFISNDDDQFRDFHNLKLELTFSDTDKRVLTNVVKLPYGKTVRVPVTVVFPATGQPRQKMQMLLRLNRGSELVSETSDPVEIFQKSAPSGTNVPVNTNFHSLSAGLSRLASRSLASSGPSGAPVILLGSGASLHLLKPGKPVRRQIEDGATAIVFSPGPEIARLFPQAVRATRKFVGEYADFSPIAGTPLARELQAMDLKWWGRPTNETNSWRTFVASQAQRLRSDGPARELVRYIPSHGYMALDKLPDQYWTVMWELPLGRGRLWICDLDVEKCAGVDPAAGLFAENLFRAAADPASTRSLPTVPSHEEMLKGNRLQ